MAEGDLFDRLPALWNTSSENPAVRVRQARAEELTRERVEIDPEYQRELSWLRSWIQTYDVAKGTNR